MKWAAQAVVPRASLVNIPFTTTLAINCIMAHRSITLRAASMASIIHFTHIPPSTATAQWSQIVTRLLTTWYINKWTIIITRWRRRRSSISKHFIPTIVISSQSRKPSKARWWRRRWKSRRWRRPMCQRKCQSKRKTKSLNRKLISS